MSYLNPLRLHFAGQFQANISTVNNDPGHFDNDTFVPSFQKIQVEQDQPNGWFNPQGDAAWRLKGCKVTAAWMSDGAPAGTGDAIASCLVADSDSQVCAKLADLDSEQQMVSMIFGLQVRIADASGNTLLRGDFRPAAFLDIWDRATDPTGGDADASAAYQSVLENLQWGDISGSPFLASLKATTEDGLLSIKFNVDSINMSDYTSPEFLCGRIVGTIGPTNATEPAHLVLGRQFMAVSDPRPATNFFQPQGSINFFPAVVLPERGAIFLDLGNAINTAVSSTGQPTLSDLGDLALTVASKGASVPLGTVPSQGPNGYADPTNNPNWYANTAGIVSLPLTAEQLAIVEGAPLTLSGPSGTPYGISEEPYGTFVRADAFVFRLSPGDAVEIQAYATQWGRPLAGATVVFKADASGLQPANDIDPNNVPPVAIPASVIGATDDDPKIGSATTDDHGVATLRLVVGDPGNPRDFIDGQVYGIRPALPDYDEGGPNPWNFVSFLVWDAPMVDEPPTWYGGMKRIFTQYGNLYPVMERFLDLTDYRQVSSPANAFSLKYVFKLDVADPNSMPVTRDLSPAKRAAILRWLDNPLVGKAAPPPPAASPLAAVAHPTVAVPFAVAPTATAKPPVVRPLSKGGKAAAAARRLSVQRASRFPGNP